MNGIFLPLPKNNLLSTRPHPTPLLRGEVTKSLPLLGEGEDGVCFDDSSLPKIQSCFFSATLVALLWFIAAPSSLLAQRPVLLTESATTSGKHMVDVYLGAEYLQKLQAPQPQLAESITRVAVFGWHHGVAENVNLDFDWRGYLFASLRNGLKNARRKTNINMLMTGF